MAVLGLLTVLACSPSEGRSKESFPSSSVTNQDDGGFSRLVEQAVAAAPMAPPSAAMEMSSDLQVLTKVESESAGGSSGALETAERKVISTAFLSIEVDLVEAATAQVRDIADSLGGSWRT